MSRQQVRSPTLRLDGFEQLAEVTTPATPSSGQLRVYPKADHKLYTLDSTGAETQVGTGAGGGTTTIQVYEAQAVTGTTVTLPFTPMSNGVVEVAVNGQALIATRDYTWSGTTVTFTTALSADDVHVEYITQPFSLANYNSAHFEITLSTGQSSITLPIAPSGVPLLTRGGVVQYQSSGHYSISGAVITLAVPIGATEDGHISVDYITGGSSASSAFHEEFLPASGATVVTLAQPPTLLLVVTRDGLAQSATDGHYSLSGSVLTFADAFDGLTRVVVTYVQGIVMGAANTVNGLSASPATAPVAGTLVATGTDGKLPASVEHALINQLTNGGFELWARGASFSGGNTYYNADRWYISCGGSSTATVARDTTNVDNSTTAIAITYTHNAQSDLWQVIENKQDIRGHQASLSIRVRCATPNAVRAALWDNGFIAFSPYHPGDGTYRTLTATGAFSASAGVVAVGLDFQASCTVYADNAMFVLGSTPADFVPLTPADDMTRALRYYQRWASGAANQDIAVGQAYSGVSCIVMCPYQAAMSLTPTMTYSALTDWGFSDPGFGQYIAATSIGVRSWNNGRGMFNLQCNVASGFTQGMATTMGSRSTAATLTLEWNP